MEMLDSYYTPKNAAEKLVSRLDFMPRNVGDFCAGGGELLRACVAQFPKVKCVAVDKSKKAVKKIFALHREWQVFHEDFLNEKKMANTGLQKGTFDLVVLNPPFTCRGKRYKFIFDGIAFSGSKALMFLVAALQYVRNGGVLRAILPSGVISTERDAILVQYLKRRYGMRVYWRSSQISFGGKTPSVVFVDIHKPIEVRVVPVQTQKKFVAPDFFSRGILNVIDAEKNRRSIRQKGTLQYVHTTDLQQGEVHASDCYVPCEGRRIVSGPCVLLPRVGTPSKGKICIVPMGYSCILSDCVIAIRCKSPRGSNRLKQLILDHWSKYAQMYVGTGARYITLKRLSLFLSCAGWKS